MLSLQQLSQPINIQQPTAVELIIDGQSIPFLPGQVTLIGSRPGMGRSLLMLYLFNLLNEKYGYAQCLVSNEEEENILFEKLIATASLTELSSVVDKKEKIIQKNTCLNSENCFLHSFFGPWEELKIQVEEIITNRGIFLLFIDKIQGLYSDHNHRNRDQEMGYIIRMLKKIAFDHQISIVLNSSMNRSVETREGKLSHLSDLRDSGSLEDIAHQIIFLNRPEYYGITEDEEGNSLKGIAYLKIAKSRSGKAENIRLLFDRTIPCFKPWSSLGVFSFSNEFNKLVETFGLEENPFELDKPF